MNDRNISRAHLEIIRGPDRGRIIALDREVSIIGRSKQCDIVLTDETISRQHIELSVLSLERGLLRLKDLDSRNGVFVNQKKETLKEIVSGDQIAIGDTIMLVRFYDSSRQIVLPGEEKSLDSDEQDTEDRLVASIGVEQVNLSDFPLGHIETDVLQKRLQTLYKVSEVIISPLPLKEKLSRLLDTIIAVIPAETGFVAVINTETGLLEPMATVLIQVSARPRSKKVSWTIINKCMTDKCGILASDAARDKRFDAADSILQEKIRSVLSVPLIFQDRLFGVIFLSTSQHLSAYNEQDLEFLTGIANEIALLIERDQNLQAQIVREKLAEVGELVAGLSHYIKNILFALTESQQMIDRALKVNDYQTINMTWPIIKNSSERIADLVNNMLYFSKERKGELQPVDIRKTIADILKLYQPVFDRNDISIQTSFDPQLKTCQLDPHSIYRVVLNLVRNAIDAVMGTADPMITFTTHYNQDRNTVEITVADNGCGIPHENLDKIFHYLFSTKGNEGTGIGLFISKRIVESHDGSLTVESESGRGARFTITLPCSHDPNQWPQAEQSQNAVDRQPDNNQTTNDVEHGPDSQKYES
ncbi:FHA domain-containing protein [bacterium]|nr:FHA domain-containing protein [bacterium]